MEFIDELEKEAREYFIRDGARASTFSFEGERIRQERQAALHRIMEYVQKRRAQYADVASDCNRRGSEAKKLSAECHELAYFDVMKEIERLATLRAAPKASL